MALKFGRTAGITSRIDPKGTIMYDEDEYDAYMTAVEAEASRKKDYDASMAKFKTDSDTYYGKSEVDTKGASKIASAYNAAGNKGSKGQSYTATAAGSKTQQQMDKEFDAMVKSGQIVPFNDPSITAKTRELYTGANYGEDLSKKYIRKQNYNDYNQIFGEDYNPIQKKKDALAGKLSQSELQTVHEPIVDIGTFSRFGAPVKPGEYVPTKIKKIDPNNVDWKEITMPTRMPTKVDAKTNPKLRRPKEKEDVTWQDPNFPHGKGVRVPQTRIKQSGKSGVEGGGKSKIVGGTKSSKIRYNTEGRQAMAYFSGKTSIGDKITGKTESELRDLKKETRGEAGRMLKEGRLGDALTIGKDLATIRKATRYTKKGDISIGSDGSINEGQGSTLRYWTAENQKKSKDEDNKTVRLPGAMYGYREFKAQQDDKVEKAKLAPLLETFKSQTGNATNRNTITNQQAKLDQSALGAASADAAPTSYYATRGQMKDKYREINPTASKQEIRQGVRKNIQTNRQTQIDLRKKEQEKNMY